MKTDSDLKRDVLAELAYEPSIKAQEIGVSVKDGVVTLNGNVPTYTEKFAAETAAKRVSGVRAIAEDLTVSLFGNHERNDSDVAQAAANALDWNVTVPQGKVKMIVENGWITLRGDVEWHYQCEAAHDAVRNVIGVKGVTNLISVKPLVEPSVSTVEVHSKIEAALKRNMMQDLESITIEAQDGKVTLRGNVHSWEERNDAAHAAWSSPGVTWVDNNLEIT